MFGSKIFEDFFSQEQENFPPRVNLGLIFHILILSKFKISSGVFFLQSGQMRVNNLMCSREKIFENKLPTILIQKVT